MQGHHASITRDTVNMDKDVGERERKRAWVYKQKQNTHHIKCVQDFRKCKLEGQETDGCLRQGRQGCWKERLSVHEENPSIRGDKRSVHHLNFS